MARRKPGEALAIYQEEEMICWFLHQLPDGKQART
jgi:hypothetical protein